MEKSLIAAAAELTPQLEKLLQVVYLQYLIDSAQIDVQIAFETEKQRVSGSFQAVFPQGFPRFLLKAPETPVRQTLTPSAEISGSDR